MTSAKKHSHRKDEHVFIAEKLQHESENQLDLVQLLPSNLPELAVSGVDISTTLCGHKITTPFFINAMTGGSKKTDKINEQLAFVAAKTNVAFATGSQSVALKDEQFATGFSQLHRHQPHVLLLGNLGANHPASHFQQAQKMLHATAMQAHINVAQELVMPEGDRSFYWSKNLNHLTKLPFEIMVKEVGFGISPQTLEKLQQIGIKYVDLSGAGGTSFTAIENERTTHKQYANWSTLAMTTAQVLIASRPYQNSFSFTASGGITSPLDVLKCLALGADNVGVSRHFLDVLLHSGTDGLIAEIFDWQMQLKKLFVLFGAKNIAALRQTPIILHGDLATFKKQIHQKNH